MEVKATAKHIRRSPRKIRLVMDVVRGKRVEEALAILKFLPHGADEGPTVKRFRSRSRGMAAPILKRTSHITVVVEERY